MKALVDTSVLVSVFRDKTQANADHLFAVIGDHDMAFTRVIVSELLAGAKDEREWQLLETFCNNKTIIEEDRDAWADAARVFFDARRAGVTIRKLTDCAIAVLAMRTGSTLYHNDHDCQMITRVRPLQQVRLDLSKSKQ
jgi:predicted nucleic acid-binding protein